MDSAPLFRLLADAVLVLHVALVLFVVAGLAVIVVGNRLRWDWVNRPSFRLAHLATIVVVAAQAWLGVVCPLTTLEMGLRVRAGAATYEGSFIAHWLHALLYWEAPPWVFVVAYSTFALAVLAVWWRFPPRTGPRRTPAAG